MKKNAVLGAGCNTVSRVPMLQICSSTDDDSDEDEGTLQPAAPQTRKCGRFLNAARDKQLREEYAAAQVQSAVVPQQVPLSSSGLPPEIADDADAMYIWNTVYEMRRAKRPMILEPAEYPGWRIEYKVRKDSSQGDIYIKPPHEATIRSTTKLHELFLKRLR